jgi:hypothetical protein
MKTAALRRHRGLAPVYIEVSALNTDNAITRPQHADNGALTNPRMWQIVNDRRIRRRYVSAAKVLLGGCTVDRQNVRQNFLSTSFAGASCGPGVGVIIFIGSAIAAPSAVMGIPSQPCLYPSGRLLAAALLQ